MSDLELLTLAAKAANTKNQGIVYYGECWRTMPGHEWNPLRSNDDANHLADILELNVERYDGNSTVAGQDCMSKWAHEPDCSDPSAAERRAIVRAAAEIVKDVP